MAGIEEFEIRIAAYAFLGTRLPEFITDEKGRVLIDPKTGKPRRYRGAIVKL